MNNDVCTEISSEGTFHANGFRHRRRRWRSVALTCEFALRHAMPPAIRETRTNFFDRNRIAIWSIRISNFNVDQLIETGVDIDIG
jgi:hypothetical protein